MRPLAPGLYENEGKYYVVEDELAEQIGLSPAEFRCERVDFVIRLAFKRFGIDPARCERLRTLNGNK